MKVGSKELFEVVRQVVRDEIRKVLPEMVARHLTEQYIKKALAEQVVSAPSKRVLPKQEYHLPNNLREIIAGDPEEEEIPEPMSNDTQGIYEPANPLIKKNEAVAKLLSRNNPMAAIYEGLDPIEPEGSTAGQPSVDVRNMAKATGMDFEKMNAMMEGMERSAARKVAAPVSTEAQERELERKRKALEVPVNTPRVR